MKRFMILLLCVALVAAAVATTAFAATTKATVSSATGKPGETVHLHSLSPSRFRSLQRVILLPSFLSS